LPERKLGDVTAEAAVPAPLEKMPSNSDFSVRS